MTAVLLAAGAAIAFAVTAALAGPLGRWARRHGLTDRPAGHKAHHTATPYLGGVALAAGVLVPVGLSAVLFGLGPGLLGPVPVGSGPGGAGPVGPGLLGPGLLGPGPAVVLVAATVVGLLGLVDDVRGLAPTVRLTVEVGLAAVVVAAGVRLSGFGPQWMDAAVTVIWIVVLTNAFNLLDNSDGALAVVTLATAVPLAVAAPASVALVLVALAAAAAGFLVHNRPPARIFLGDAGSLFIGFVLAAAVPLLGPVTSDAGAGPAAATVAAAVIVMAPALIDTTLVVVSRLRHGRSILTGGTDHVAHRLRRVGLRPAAVLVVLGVGAGGAGLVAIAIRGGALPAVPVLVLTVTLVGLAVLGLLRIPGYPATEGPEPPVRLPRLTT